MNNLAELLVNSNILQSALDLEKSRKDNLIPKTITRIRNGKQETAIVYVSPKDKEVISAYDEGLDFEYHKTNKQVNLARIKAAREKKEKEEQAKQQQEEENKAKERLKFIEERKKVNKQSANREAVQNLPSRVKKNYTMKQLEAKNNEFFERIHSGKQPLKIRQSDLNPHTEGNPQYEKRVAKGVQTSIITIPLEKCQELINKYAGTGIIDVSARDYPNQMLEMIFDSDTEVGYCVSSTGVKTPTNCFKIHYSKDGAHIVPLNPA